MAMTKGFFPRCSTVTPSIYAYEEPGNVELASFLKIGFTNGDVRKRIAQQYPAARPGKPPYKIVLEESAMKNDGSSFTDHDVHRLLRKRGFANPKSLNRIRGMGNFPGEGTGRIAGQDSRSQDGSYGNGSGPPICRDRTGY
jgi:hypothetical protein